MERGGGALARLARDTGSLGDKGALAPRPVTGTRRRSSGTCGFASPGGGGRSRGKPPGRAGTSPPGQHQLQSQGLTSGTLPSLPALFLPM